MWTEISKYLHDPFVLVIISILFGGFVAAKIYFFFLKARDKRIAQKAFKSIWISSKKLKYKDLSGRKEYPEKSPSTQNDLTIKIQEILNNSGNILFISEAMAGKTYFTINYLRKLENAYVLIPDYDRFDKLFEFIPEAPRSSNYKIVLLDDIHTYFNTGVTRLASFIEKAIDEGYIIWANTITGSDFEIVRNNISIKTLSTFRDFTIPSTLSNDEALKIAKSEGIDDLPSQFDGNIGSIFYDIKQKKDKYKRLDSISKSILLAIKQLYLVGIYSPPTNVSKSDMLKLFQYFETGISLETITKKIDELKIDGFLLNNRNPKNICFEEKWLRTVVEPDLKVKDFMIYISEIFPKNLATYTQAMQSANTYVEAEKIYQEMCSNFIQPSARPFAVLMGKANDSEIALGWLIEMDKLGILPNDFIVNILLRLTKGDIEKKERVIAELELRNIEVKKIIKDIVQAPKIQLDLYGYSNLMNLSGSYENALNIFNEMKHNNIFPDSITYNILIKLSNNINIGEILLDEMITSNIQPDVYTYGILMNLSRDYYEGKKYFDKMTNEGIIPNEAIFSILIKLSNSFIIGKKLLFEMREKGIYTPAHRFGFVINLAPNFKEGKMLFDEMISFGITPSSKEYGTLINISSDFKEGKKLFNEMISNGIQPTNKEYSTLINICPDFEEGKMLFDEMISNGILPNVFTYGTLINLSHNFIKAKELFDEMRKNEIFPNVEIYGTLINLSQNFQEGKKLFDEMRSNGISPNVFTYGTLINLSHNFIKAKELFDEMKKNEIFPNVEIYGTLINLSGNYKVGKQFFDEMIETRIEPNSEIYGTLMKLSNSYEIALKLFCDMQNHQIKKTNSTYGTLMNLSGDYIIANQLFDEMIRSGIEPNAKTFGTRINLSHNFEIGMQLFDEMKEKGIEIDISIYGTLISLSKEYIKSKQLFDEMILKGIEPNVGIYTMLIRVSRDINIGRVYLKEMIENKIKPNIWTYNSLIWLCKNNYQEALSILQLEMPIQFVNPDVVTYTQLMNISRNFDIAINLFNEMCMNNIYPNDRTYGVLEVLAGTDSNKQNKLDELRNEYKLRN